MSRAGTLWSASVRATRCALLAAETVGTLRTGLGRDTDEVLLQRAASAALDVHRIQLELHGRIPPFPAVVVANHVSWLDPLVMLALAPAIPLAKREVLGWPVVGPTAHRLGAVFVRRDDPHSGARAIRKMARALTSGQRVLGFPEGTTSAGDVLPFRRGLFGLALLARVPVVPVAITWSDRRAAWVGDDGFVPHWLSVCGGAPLRVTVRVGRTLLAGTTPERLAVDAREQIVSLLEPWSAA